MDAINLSPANRALLQNYQTMQPRPKTIKQAPKKNGKKLLLAGAIALASVGVAAILISSKKTNKLKNYAKNVLTASQDVNGLANSVLENAQDVHQEAKGIVDEFLELFKKGAESNFADVLDESGNAIVKYQLNSQGQVESIIQSGVDGFKKRTGNFIDGFLNDIICEKNDGIIDRITLHCYSSDINQIQKKFQKMADGCHKCEELFGFFGDDLDSYIINYVALPDDTQKCGLLFNFLDNKFVVMLKEYEDFADGSQKIQEGFGFEDGKLKFYAKAFELLADKTVKIQEYFEKCEDKFIYGTKPEFNSEKTAVATFDEVGNFLANMQSK